MMLHFGTSLQRRFGPNVVRFPMMLRPPPPFLPVSTTRCTSSEPFIVVLTPVQVSSGVHFSEKNVTD